MVKPLILIIEDDESISLGLKVFFENKGYGVFTTAVGHEGLAVALKEIPDAVLLDLKLPDIYGIEVLKSIKKDYPEISVIVMTGYGEIAEAVIAMKSGAEYYFQKPIDLEELAVVVERALGIKQIRQESVLYRESLYPIAGRS